jgi:hypothetical protein
MTIAVNEFDISRGWMRYQTEPAAGDKWRDDAEPRDRAPVRRTGREVERESGGETAADSRAIQWLQVQRDNALIDGDREAS